MPGAADRFAILCMGRTGSTLLVDLLDSHPGIECRGEIFGPREGLVETPHVPRRDFLSHAAWRTAKPVKGFKMADYWIPNHPGLVDDVKELGFRFVRLRRDDVLAQFVSMKLAILNSNWESRETYQNKTLEVDAGEFVAFASDRDRQEAWMDGLCRGTPTVQIEYGQLLDPRAQARILDFLGVRRAGPLRLRHHRLRAGRIKALDVPLRQAIRNWGDLRREVDGSPLERFLRN